MAENQFKKAGICCHGMELPRVRGISLSRSLVVVYVWQGLPIMDNIGPFTGKLTSPPVAGSRARINLLRLNTWVSSGEFQAAPGHEKAIA